MANFNVCLSNPGIKPLYRCGMICPGSLIEIGHLSLNASMWFRNMHQSIIMGCFSQRKKLSRSKLLSSQDHFVLCLIL
jgi:hypothetical protein